MSDTLPASQNPVVSRVAASLAARSRFDAGAHLRLTVEGRQVGWLPRVHARILRAQDAVPAVLGEPR